MKGVVESMKIQGIKSFQVNPYRQNQFTPQKNMNSFGKLQDKLAISNQAKLMQEVSGFEKERSERIARIKEEVQTNAYRPNPEEIAKSMYQFYRGK